MASAATFLAWQLLQAWCWLDRAEMGSEARLSSWTLLVSGSYLKVLNMAIDLVSVDESRLYVLLGRDGCVIVLI